MRIRTSTILLMSSALALAPTAALAQHVDVGPGGVGLHGDGPGHGERRVVEEHHDSGHSEGAGHHEERREGHDGGGGQHGDRH